MEVVMEGNDVRLKRLSDMMCKQYGMRCVASSFSVWCNVNGTVEDALKIINANLHRTDVMTRAMWGEKIELTPSDIITANVYYHYAKFVYLDGAQTIVVNVVHPKHEVITLSSDTKLWRAKEMMNEKRLSLQKEASETFNGIGKFTEFIRGTRPRGNRDNLSYPKSRLQIEENRLWLKIRTQ